MRLLVTGANGFIGARVAAELAAKGHEVLAQVRPGSRGGRLERLVPGARIVEGDLLGEQTWAASLASTPPDACVHLGWVAGPGYLDAHENAAFVVSGVDLAERLAHMGCARIVGVGTCFEYASSSQPLREDAPLGPTSAYARAKVACAEALGEVSSIRVAWARLFFVYGHDERPGRLVPSVLGDLAEGRRARITRGLQIRDFLHADDVARALAAIALSPFEGPINVGSGVGVRVLDLAEKLASLVGARVPSDDAALDIGAIPERLGDPPVVVADDAKLKRLGFVPSRTIDEGLADVVERFFAESEHE